jgi:hypothetical protein
MLPTGLRIWWNSAGVKLGASRATNPAQSSFPAAKNRTRIWFGFAGLFLRRARGLYWLLLPILYFTLLTGTVEDARFRAPIEPLLCLFTATALTRPPKATRAVTQDVPAD